MLNVTFALRKVKTGTKLTFIQTGIRSNQVASLKKGWTEFYWKPLKEMLEKG